MQVLFRPENSNPSRVRPSIFERPMPSARESMQILSSCSWVRGMITTLFWSIHQVSCSKLLECMNRPRDGFSKYLPLNREYSSIREITSMGRLLEKQADDISRDADFV